MIESAGRFEVVGLVLEIVLQSLPQEHEDYGVATEVCKPRPPQSSRSAMLALVNVGSQ